MMNGREHYRVVRCDGDIHGEWFVSRTLGVFDDAEKASQFAEHQANEIAKGCREAAVEVRQEAANSKEWIIEGYDIRDFRASRTPDRNPQLVTRNGFA